MRYVLAMFCSIGIAAAVLAQDTGIPWVKSYDDALAQSRAEGKPMFVEFYADWCGPCKQMDAEVYSKPEVVKALEGYICAKIDVDAAMNVAAAYQVNSIPRFVVVSPDGKVVGDQIGFVRQDYFMNVLDMIAEDIADGIDGTPIPSVSSSLNVNPTAEPAGPTAEERVAKAEDTQDWLALLGDVDPSVRETAGAELAKRGSTGAWILVEALASDYLGTRIGAYEAVSKNQLSDLSFDPWAEPADRKNALKAWRVWRDKQLAATSGALAKPIAESATPEAQ